MKNAIAIDQNLNITLVSSTDDGSNSLIINWNCDLSQSPTMTVAGASIVPSKSDFSYEIPEATWTGDGSFTVTVSANGKNNTFTINQVSNVGNVMLQKVSDNEFSLGLAKTSNDISDKTVDVIETITEQFPEITPGDRVSEMVGKIKKYLEDVKENGGNPPKMMINENGHLIAIYD